MKPTLPAAFAARISSVVLMIVKRGSRSVSSTYVWMESKASRALNQGIGTVICSAVTPEISWRSVHSVAKNEQPSITIAPRNIDSVSVLNTDLLFAPGFVVGRPRRGAGPAWQNRLPPSADRWKPPVSTSPTAGIWSTPTVSPDPIMPAGRPLRQRYVEDEARLRV